MSEGSIGGGCEIWWVLRIYALPLLAPTLGSLPAEGPGSEGVRRTVPGVAPTCRSTRDEGRAVGKLVKRRRTGSQKDCEGSVFSIREPPSNADSCHYREVHYGRGGLPRFREKTLFRDHAIRRIDPVSAFRRLRFARVPPSSRTSIHQNSSLVSQTVDWYGANDGDGGHGVTTGVITVRFFAKNGPKRPRL